MVQLQGLVVQLREGLHCALEELSELRQRTNFQEETLQSHLRDVDRKFIGLKNSLNTFKEELGGAVLQVKEVTYRQREVQKKMELLHTQHTPQRRSSKAELEGHSCLTSQSELSVIQHYSASLTNHNNSSSRSSASTQSGPPARRQRAALELLESERVYVAHLSLLLKANISFNGSETLITKDKRLFPSSLRFLIQQHLELLHTLQERVLKTQWQGIMGDVFMKLTSKESDFLDFYVSYLKELPDCLAVVSMLTSSSEVPSHDHHMTIVSTMKQLFTECGIQTNTMGSLCPISSSMIEHVNQVKRSKQRLLDQIQSRTGHQDCQEYPDWNGDQRYHKERSGPLPYFGPDQEPRNPNKQTGLRSIPESAGGSGAFRKHRLACRGPAGPELHPGAAGSALAQALGEFLPPPSGGETPETEGLCEEDGESLRDGRAFDRSPGARRPAAADAPASHEAYVRGGRYGGFPGRGCVSPDEAVMMRPGDHRSLQASQRKSKSLNGLQLDSTVSSGDTGPDHGHRRALERQGSNKGCPTPTRRGQSSVGNSPHCLDPDKHITATTKDPGGQLWGEEPKWRGGAEDLNHTPLSERSRKQEKGGGFRSSFKRLFKKNDQESSKTQRPGHLEADRGTAV
ncbi:hypothetical protein NHX12_022565 [Muraenolepis orangiensis]|uniref:DH domain-containing protein n=1 Tax=Muraenolepis orangiensis TaxID=630683 RepID=A0A9Q0ERR4_9TELE|nr:hypothetical protein NHX12_022565 [Muraenolepis orangiensis]